MALFHHHEQSKLETLGTYGPGFAWILVTIGQAKVCGGIRKWARGGFGAEKYDERERVENEIEHHLEQRLDLYPKEDGYNGA